MYFILAAVTIVIILLIIMSVVLCPTSTNNQSQYFTSIPTNISSLSIIIDNNNFDGVLSDYINLWGYGLNDINCKYLFYLNDIPSNINLNKNLEHIISMIGISDYVMFNNSTSFIVRRNTLLNTFAHVNNLFLRDCTINMDELETILNFGFPYRTNNGAVLHESYLNNIIHSTSLEFKDITIMPSYIPAIKETTPSVIPKIIHQTFESRALPFRFINAIKTWIHKNPEYEYRYYDNGDRRDFIKRNFDKSVLNAYDKLIPGAYKADLWRYCVIYIAAGVYIDIKMGDIIIHSDTSMVFVNDVPDEMIYNAFFASFPRNPIIYNLILSVVKNIEDGYYGLSPLFPTGPAAMGKSIISSLGYETHLPIGKTVTKYGNIQVLIFKHIDKGGKIGPNDKDIYILTRNTPDTHDQEYLYHITGNMNYGPLWNKRQIYL